MKNYKYIGTFKSFIGHTYQLEVTCGSFTQAFFLLTAKAIGEGKHYQLDTIEDEKGKTKYIDDIVKVTDLIQDNLIPKHIANHKQK